MKKVVFVFALIGAISLFGITSCSTLGGTSNNITTTGTVDPSSAGNSLGGAISSLYGQYKQNGSIPLTNVSNLLMMQQLINNANVYKENYSNTNFLGSFASGLVTGSNNLVNSSNQSSVLSSVLNIANSGAAVSTPTASGVMDSVSSISKAASSVNTLMSLFGK
ncbi:MAG: hypothetical protein WCR36_02290 [Bacteroidaceae bacterium]